MRSTFTLPADISQRFLHSLRKNNIAQMGQSSKFISQLYKQKTGK
jgi:hypothetical protein